MVKEDPRYDETTPARAVELVAELRHEGRSVFLGPIHLGLTQRARPAPYATVPTSSLGLDNRTAPAPCTHAWDASEVKRSVAARPPSRLLTGTSLGSEPVALTVPVWWQRQDFWDAGPSAEDKPTRRPAPADPETERHQSPIRGLAQPRGCSRTAKFSPPPLGASSFQRVAKTDGNLSPFGVRSLDFRGH